MHDSFENDVTGEMPPVQEHADLSKICRLELWDGTATVMYAASDTTTIREALGILCERRGVGLSAIDVFFAGEERALNLDADINMLAGKDVVVEKRTLFRLDMLPIRRSVGIKAKSSKSVVDVLRPVLEKYGLVFEHLHAKITGEKDFLDMGQLVNVLDNLRVAVDFTPEIKQSDASYKDKRRKSKEKFRTLTKTTQGGNRKDLSVNIHQPQILNKNDKNELLKIMSASQSGKMDDQRGLISEMNLELPDFLKISLKEDLISQNGDSSSSMTTTSDTSSDIFDGNNNSSNNDSSSNNSNINNNNNNNNVVLRKYRTSVHRNLDGLFLMPGNQGNENISLKMQTNCRRQQQHQQQQALKNEHDSNKQQGTYCISQWNLVTPVMSQLPPYQRSFSSNSTHQLLAAADSCQYNDFKAVEAEDRDRGKRKIKSILV